MRTSLALTCLLIGAALSGPSAQGSDSRYVLIDGDELRGRLIRAVNITKLRQRLTEMTDGGYTVRELAASATSVNVLLERGGGGPGSHRLIAEGDESGFLRALNQAATQGYRVVHEGIKAFDESVLNTKQTTWLALVVKRPDAPAATYSVVKGARDVEAALAASHGSGRTLIQVLGRAGLLTANTLVFFEQAGAPALPPDSAPQRDYRVVSAARTSAMGDDLRAAANEGFRVIGAGHGYMTVVMAREPGGLPPPVEYRLVATIRIETGVRELQEAGTDGFRVVATSENGSEAVFVMERRPGGSERFEYRIAQLQEGTANRILVDAEAEGYRLSRLLDDLVLLERAPEAP